MFEVVYGLDKLTEKNLADFYPLLSPQRREKVDQLKFLPDKLSSACAFLLLRLLSFEHESCDKCEFLFDEHGKPYPSHGYFRFSLAHTRKGVCVCMNNRFDVGADVEEKVKYDEALARRILSPRELEYLAKAEDKEDYLTCQWILKESYGKKTGEGVFEILQQTDYAQMGHKAIMCYAKNFYEINEIDGLYYGYCAPRPERVAVTPVEDFLERLKQLPPYEEARDYRAEYAEDDDDD